MYQGLSQLMIKLKGLTPSFTPGADASKVQVVKLLLLGFTILGLVSYGTNCYPLFTFEVGNIYASKH